MGRRPLTLISLILFVILPSMVRAASTTPAGRVGTLVDMRGRLPPHLWKIAPNPARALHYKADMRVGRHGVPVTVHWTAFRHEARVFLIRRRTDRYILSYWVEVKQPKGGIVLRQPVTHHIGQGRKDRVLERVSILIPWENTATIGADMGNARIEIRADGKFSVSN